MKNIYQPCKKVEKCGKKANTKTAKCRYHITGEESNAKNQIQGIK